MDKSYELIVLMEEEIIPTGPDFTTSPQVVYSL